MSSLKNFVLKLVILLFILILFGTVGYMLIERWNLLDSLFMSVITLTTVGYGQVHPLTQSGIIFTIIYILFGVILFLYLAAQFANSLSSFNLDKHLRKQNMEKKLKLLKNHIILCGFGRTGYEIALQLKRYKIEFIIVDKDPSVEEKASEFEAPFILGDATEDETLQKAGILKAKGLLCALSDDVDNLYIVLSAKNINPDLIIVTRCIKAQNESKFKKAGANKIILPYEISGRRMVSSIIKPAVVDFLDVVVHTKGHELELEMEQYCIKAGGTLENTTIYDSAIRQQTGIIVIGIKREDGFISSPSPETVLKANDCLIILGTIQQLTNFEKFAG
jgi:voltage-gated potassium channel